MKTLEPRLIILKVLNRKKLLTFFNRGLVKFEVMDSTYDKYTLYLPISTPVFISPKPYLHSHLNRLHPISLKPISVSTTVALIFTSLRNYQLSYLLKDSKLL